LTPGLLVLHHGTETDRFAMVEYCVGAVCASLGSSCVCLCASRDFAGTFLLWRLKELKRRNYGSSEGETRLGVLGVSTNLHNIVALCLFVRFEERATY